MTRCPCRRCSPGYFGSFSAILGASLTTDDRVRGAVDRYVLYGGEVEALERDLDECLGITHERHKTGELRRELARLARRQRVRAWLA